MNRRTRQFFKQVDRYYAHGGLTDKEWRYHKRIEWVEKIFLRTEEITSFPYLTRALTSVMKEEIAKSVWKPGSAPMLDVITAAAKKYLAEEDVSASYNPLDSSRIDIRVRPNSTRGGWVNNILMTIKV